MNLSQKIPPNGNIFLMWICHIFFHWNLSWMWICHKKKFKQIQYKIFLPQNSNKSTFSTPPPKFFSPWEKIPTCNATNILTNACPYVSCKCTANLFAGTSSLTALINSYVAPSHYYFPAIFLTWSSHTYCISQWYLITSKIIETFRYLGYLGRSHVTFVWAAHNTGDVATYLDVLTFGFLGNLEKNFIRLRKNCYFEKTLERFFDGAVDVFFAKGFTCGAKNSDFGYTWRGFVRWWWMRKYLLRLRVGDLWCWGRGLGRIHRLVFWFVEILDQNRPSDIKINCGFESTWGIHLGLTNAPASMTWSPDAESISMSWTLSNVETTEISFCRPSRGPTSTSLTKSGRVLSKN